MNTKEPIHLNDGTVLTPVNQSYSEQARQFQQLINTPEYQNYTANQMKEKLNKNLINSNDVLQNIQSSEERLKFLTDRIDTTQSELEKQTNALQKVSYENIKLNAQVEVLNKTIDSKSNELDRLRDINSQLKATNKTLSENQKSNKGYWIKTAIIAIATTILGFLLGKYL